MKCVYGVGPVLCRDSWRCPVADLGKPAQVFRIAAVVVIWGTLHQLSNLPRKLVTQVERELEEGGGQSSFPSVSWLEGGISPV